jgi:hypothetical protein
MRLLLNFIFALTVASGGIAFAALPSSLKELNQWYSSPPTNENAAELILRGADYLSKNPNLWRSNFPWVGAAEIPELDKPIPVAVVRAMSDYLRRSEGALYFLRQAAELESSRYPVDFNAGADALLPHLTKLESVERYLWVCALQEANRGNSDKAAEPLRICFALSRSVQQEPCLVSQTVRVNVMRRSLPAMEQVLNRVALSASQLMKIEELLQKLERFDVSGVGFFRGLVGDRLIAPGFYELDTETQKSLIARILPGTNTQQAFHLRDERSEIDSDKAFADGLFVSTLKLWEKPIAGRVKAVLDETAKQSDKAKENRFVMSFVYANRISDAAKTEIRSVASLRIALTAIALERFRLTNGSYPESLEQITALPPTVIQNPCNGEPFKYERISQGYMVKFEQPELLATNAITFRVINPPPSRQKPAAR